MIQVEHQARHLALTFDDGSVGRFHYFWLRENCACAECMHPEAWERILDLLSIPRTIAPTEVEAESDGLILRWPDGHHTRYSAGWLLGHRCEPDARRARRERPITWRAAEVSKETLTVAFDEVVNGDGLRNWLETLKAHGVAFVSGVPTDEGALLRLVERIGRLESSHFGWDFHVRSKPDPENLAYTAHALAPHNDLPSRQQMPGIQFLHCLLNRATGGESVVVDGVTIAEQLREDDPAGFDFLASRPVTFTSVADDWSIVNRSPVIRLDADGEVAGVRLHQALLGPVDVDPDDMDRFYDAYLALTALAADPANQLVFRLEPGDVQSFDNERVLHARQAFDPASGARHLHGCYVARDDAWSRLDLLRRGDEPFRSR